MRNAILFWFLLVPVFLHSQAISEDLKSLEKRKKFFTDKIISLNDSVTSIDAKINDLNSKEIINQFKDSRNIAIAIKGGIVRQKPELFGDVIKTFEQDSKVVILDYYDGYFGVCYNSLCGYISDVWIKRNDKIDELLKIKEAEQLERKRVIDEIKQKTDKIEFAEIEKKRIKKFGEALYNKLKAGGIWIGMTDEMALISLGYPKETNRTVNAYGIHEQWVYENQYYYFDNGKLTSYQD